jgi:hypothetical protein
LKAVQNKFTDEHGNNKYEYVCSVEKYKKYCYRMPPMARQTKGQQPLPDPYFDEEANTAFLQLCAAAKEAGTLHYLNDDADTDDESDCAIQHSGVNARLSHHKLRGNYDGLRVTNFDGISLCAVQLLAGRDMQPFLQTAAQSNLPLALQDGSSLLAKNMWVVEFHHVDDNSVLTVPHLALAFSMFATCVRNRQCTWSKTHSPGMLCARFLLFTKDACSHFIAARRQARGTLYWQRTRQSLPK